MAGQTFKNWSVLAASTIAFTVCFAIWMMFAVIAVPIKKTLKSTVCARP
jgi:NNP family nitrate/nitrite transporter-like MFS transporter